MNNIFNLRQDDRVTVQGTLLISLSLFGMRLYMNDYHVL